MLQCELIHQFPFRPDVVVRPSFDQNPVRNEIVFIDSRIEPESRIAGVPHKKCRLIENCWHRHRVDGHTILSWTLHPPEIAERFEPQTPPIAERLRAMRRCADAGYPIRAVLMPLIPVPDWLDHYAVFMEQLLSDMPIQRLTIGAICSYQGAYHLMNRKLGAANVIAESMDHTKSVDGRMRYPVELREKAYRRLIQTAKRIRPDLEVGLCLETDTVFESLELQDVVGQCNCVL
jgi:hypothetical protein